MENRQFSSSRNNSRSFDLQGYLLNSHPALYRPCWTRASWDKKGGGRITGGGCQTRPMREQPHAPFSPQRGAAPAALGWRRRLLWERDGQQPDAIAPAILLKHFCLPFKGLAWGHSSCLCRLISWPLGLEGGEKLLTPSISVPFPEWQLEPLRLPRRAQLFFKGACYPVWEIRHNFFRQRSSVPVQFSSPCLRSEA